ncbi:uncharacterized protein N7500_000808 [Penicillium coprophilum]|uniref:uncharacterized protein n=1 Tax=Penicillium coprophilum TaxID=36646 RepID=UPI00239E1691|nr:uncharacterized protein N7500_000808 [Penicillium coprophilum]KAJ5178109.1 hypothetical protein N7500_000808 [Penicillium coprophilum]
MLYRHLSKTDTTCYPFQPVLSSSTIRLEQSHTYINEQRSFITMPKGSSPTAAAEFSEYP